MEVSVHPGAPRPPSRSGKRDPVESHRLVCNLRQPAPLGLARQFYDTQRARGKSHHPALRALGNRWLEVLWHCLTNQVPYDEATHVANRNRALGVAA